jgi:uncharacterized RDD family membrane protein YckC
MSGEAIQVPAGLTVDGLLGRRYMARFVDSIVLVVIVGAAGAILPASGPIVSLLIVMAAWIGYSALLESSATQATVGKMCFKLRVYNSAGGRVSLLQAAGRSAIKDAPFILFGLIPGAQILSLVWLVLHVVVMHQSQVYQAIHDRLAHTWVAAPESTIQLRLS